MICNLSMSRSPDMARYLSTLALALAAAWMTPEAKAEKVVVYREGQLVQPQDVAAVLGNTRSIRLLDDQPMAPKTSNTVPSVSLATTSAAPAPKARRDSNPDASALSLPVRFAFDSTDILPAARSQLDSLAEGIKLLGPDRIVTIEGHTDAIGADEYNFELSQARARAVRDYLVERHGIDGARLKTVGYGKLRPIESDPYSAINRRVQFHGS